MANDLKQAIDEKIRRLQMLRELADDPEAIQMLRELLPVNGNGATAHTQTTKEKQLVLKSPSKRKRGELLQTVEIALEAAPGMVTTAEVVEALINFGYVFQSANPRVSVNEALNTLKARGLAKVVDSQGVENRWLWVPKDKAAE